MEQLKKNILILGIGQSNFLNSLYGGILKRSDSFNFHIDVLNHLNDDTHNQAATVFSESLNFKKYANNLTKFQKRILFIKAIKKSFYREIFLFEWSQKKSIRRALQICQKLALKEYVYKNCIEPKKFEILHFHFCTMSNLEYLHFIGKETKVVCSFWGSDLFRVSDIRNNYYVSKALNNANIITVQSPEMALTLKAKYGMHLSDKIKDIRFTISTDIYEAINLYRADANELELFRRKYNLDQGKILVALGHNAFKENNHVEMINALKFLPVKYQHKITFILHLSYGRKEDYLAELTKIIEEAENLDIKTIDQFMAPAEIAKLRLITDVMIQAPVSDALSGAMKEVLYAGNKVIAGGWLPYGILRRNDINFEEIDKFEDLHLKLIKTIEKEDQQLETAKKNKKSIEAFLFPEKTSSAWIELFNKLLHE